ncbi:MAG: hypothetical protein R3330_20170, partial [Saprospiraceae bacterium]|nr:hypothetical protein [Saprospiraceae bacterium]
AELLSRWLGRIGNDNDQGEYYLTDIVALAVADGVPVAAPIPVANINPNPVICDRGDTNNCNGYGYDAAALDAIINEMSGVTSIVNDPNVTIEVRYEHIGGNMGGFCGNPYGPDVWPLTTVSITGREFVFTPPLISAVFGTPDLECSATLTGEDFMTCEDGVSVPPC